MTTTTTHTSEPTAYDEVPYLSVVFTNTHPERIASIAKFFGYDPVDPRKARVLEIGCAAGANILPMAASLPGSTFVGFDLSMVQVEEGKRAIERTGLTNVEIHHLNVLDLEDQFGTFDYIIAHGIYSWVPPVVQEKILTAVKHLLNPTGIGFVSYNALPGWRLRGAMRDMMTYHAALADNVADRVAHARELAELLAEHTPESTAFGMLMREENKALQGWDDRYFVHDSLGEFNEALYLHEFVRRAELQGLGYLGDAEVPSMFIPAQKSDLKDKLSVFESDSVRFEQYLDFFGNRMFRQSLLMHESEVHPRKVQVSAFRNLYFHSRLTLEGADVGFSGGEKQTFETTGKRQVHIAGPIGKAALRVLSMSWNRAISFEEIVDKSRRMLEDAGESAAAQSLETWQEDRVQELDSVLMYCVQNAFATPEIHSSQAAHVPPERPYTTTVAREEAAAGKAVTNLRHEGTTLDTLSRTIVILCNGERDLKALVDELERADRNGALGLKYKGEPLATHPDRIALLNQIVANYLDQITRIGLFVDPELR